MQMVLPFLAVLLVGFGVALETPINALLTKSSGSLIWATWVSFLVGTAALTAVVVVLRPRLSEGFPASAPWYAWSGGLYGVLVVALAAWATPKLGAGSTLVVIVAAQVALGVLLDHFGVLGLELHPVSWLRAAGVLIVTVGAVMVARG